MKRDLTLPQLPKTDSSGNINQQELVQFLSAIQRILDEKQREDYNENNLKATEITDINSEITDIKKAISWFSFLGSDTTTGSTGVNIPISSSTVNRGGFTRNTDNTRLFVPKDGYYFIEAQQLLALTANGTAYYNLQRNGTTIIHGYATFTSPAHQDTKVSAILKLSAGDYIRIRLTATVNCLYWGGGHGWLSVFYIGED